MDYFINKEIVMLDFILPNEGDRCPYCDEILYNNNYCCKQLEDELKKQKELDLQAYEEWVDNATEIIDNYEYYNGRENHDRL